MHRKYGMVLDMARQRFAASAVERYTLGPLCIMVSCIACSGIVTKELVTGMWNMKTTGLARNSDQGFDHEDTANLASVV